MNRIIILIILNIICKSLSHNTSNTINVNFIYNDNYNKEVNTSKTKIVLDIDGTIVETP